MIHIFAPLLDGLMPLGRDAHLPWDIQARLQLSDDFMMSRLPRAQR